jgi:hypothetical protein
MTGLPHPAKCTRAVAESPKVRRKRALLMLGRVATLLAEQAEIGSPLPQGKMVRRQK